MSFCIRHLRVDNLFRQLKMELCMVEDYEIASWFVSWLSLEPQRPTLSMVLNYDTYDINALDYNIQQQERTHENKSLFRALRWIMVLAIWWIQRPKFMSSRRQFVFGPCCNRKDKIDCGHSESIKKMLKSCALKLSSAPLKTTRAVYFIYLSVPTVDEFVQLHIPIV